MKLVLAIVAASVLVTVGYGRVVPKQTNVCTQEDIDELNSLAERVNACRASLPCNGTSLCSCCKALKEDKTGCCDKYASGLVLYRQCEKSGAESNGEKRQIEELIAEIAVELFLEGCKYLFERLLNSDDASDGAVFLSTGTVGFVAAVCTASQLSF